MTQDMHQSDCLAKKKNLRSETNFGDSELVLLIVAFYSVSSDLYGTWVWAET